MAGLALLLAAARGQAAEVRLPPQSPMASVTQQVGITTIRVDYARAALGRRALLSTAAPAGRLWAPGEAVVPRISFNREVDFLGVPVAAGSYSLLVIPGPTTWTVMLNRDIYLARASRYRPDLEVARGQAAVHPGDARDRLEVTFANFDDDGGTLQLAWGESRVDMPIQVHTREQVQEQISALDNGWRWYADAAEYMLKVRRDYDTGLHYADQSIALQRNGRNTQLRTALFEARERLRAAGAADVHRAMAKLDVEPGREMGRQKGRAELRQARLSLAREDSESRVFHATIEAATTGALGAERALPRPEIADKAPSASAIGAVIRRGRAELQACYQRALRQDPSLTRARVKITINVGTSGMVKRITTDPARPPAALDGCIHDSVTRWAFPLSNVDYQAELPLSVRGSN